MTTEFDRIRQELARERAARALAEARVRDVELELLSVTDELRRNVSAFQEMALRHQNALVRLAGLSPNGGGLTSLERELTRVAAETIGPEFARSMGIEATDQAALAKLRGLSADEGLRGAQTQPGTRAPSYETTPILDGKLITETAESAYKARRQPRVPLQVGRNSADTAGNRIKAATKDQLFARYGQWSAEAKAAYDPDG